MKNTNFMQEMSDKDYNELVQARKDIKQNISYLRRNASKIVLEQGEVLPEEYIEALRLYVAKYDYITKLLNNNFGMVTRFKRIIEQSGNSIK